MTLVAYADGMTLPLPSRTIVVEPVEAAVPAEPPPPAEEPEAPRPEEEAAPQPVPSA